MKRRSFLQALGLAPLATQLKAEPVPNPKLEGRGSIKLEFPDDADFSVALFKARGDLFEYSFWMSSNVGETLMVLNNLEFGLYQLRAYSMEYLPIDVMVVCDEVDPVKPEKLIFVRDRYWDV